MTYDPQKTPSELTDPGRMEKDSGLLRLLFVYGTLKQGFGNHRLLGDSMPRGEGVTRSLFSMSGIGIPFVHKSPSRYPIHGELYEVDERTLARVDALEGHPHFYRRELVTVDTDAGGTVDAWMYLVPEEGNPYDLYPTGWWPRKD